MRCTAIEHGARRARARAGCVALLGLLLGLLVCAPPLGAAEPASVSVRADGDRPLYRGTRAVIALAAFDEKGKPLASFDGEVVLEGLTSFATGEPVRASGKFAAGAVRLEEAVVAGDHVRARSSSGAILGEVATRSGYWTLAPPLLAIALALLTRQVLLSLFCGVWAGTTLVSGSLNPIASLLRAADGYLIGSIAKEDNAFIVLFSLSVAGLVGLITRAGGVRGIVDVISRLARTRRSGQLSTWLLGTIIFFDDYANCLIIGNTMRPFTDRLRISREKLSFIVDATAAPVATLGIISTWTAYQVSLIEPALSSAGAAVDSTAYVFFLRSIPYSLYSLLMLYFVFLCGWTGRDFGPMRRAEERCRDTGAVLRDGARPLIDAKLDGDTDRPALPPRWANAAVPLVCLIGLTFWGLIALDFADGFKPLLWGAIGASAVAAVMVLAQGMRLSDAIDSWVEGARALMLAIMILVLAWSISAVCSDLRTGDFVVSLTRDALSPRLLPFLAFLTAGAIAFATGTSYGTMGILVPIILPLAFDLGAASGFAADSTERIALATVAAILGGAVFGDHCSPISDTTVLSSMASGADHIDHVRTQLPYALFVAGIAAAGYLLLGLGAHPGIAVPVTAAVMAGGFYVVTGMRPRSGQ